MREREDSALAASQLAAITAGCDDDSALAASQLAQTLYQSSLIAYGAAPQ
jgi:hypothetical protein